MTTENSCNLTSADVSGEPYQSNTLDVTKCQRMMMRIYFMAQMIRAKVAISYLKVFVFAFSTRCEFQFQNFHLILLSHDLLTKKKCVIMPFESNRANRIHLCRIFWWKKPFQIGINNFFWCLFQKFLCNVESTFTFVLPKIL